MTRYIQFTTEDSNTILLEVAEPEFPTSGVAKVGLRSTATKAVAEAQSVFEAAIQGIVRVNVETFYKAVSVLPDPPSEVEMSFGIKATGEIGNFAVSKMGGEANYTVKIAWKSAPKQTP